MLPRLLSALRPLTAVALVSALVAGAPRAARGQGRSRSSEVTFDGGQASLSGGASRTALTLDRELHQAAERLLRRASPRAGALVAIDAASGEVLAFAEVGNAHLLEGAQAPAASLFKIVTTAALLERGGVDPTDSVCTDGGAHSVERRHLEPARGASKTCAPFSAALGHSRNAAFAQLVTERLERDQLIDVAARLGFNRPAQFDRALQFGSFRAPVGDLAFARAATGFEGSTLSPVGAAALAYTIASGGRVPRIHLLRDEGRARRVELGERAIEAETARRVARMMEVTVSEGTSRDAFHAPGTHSPYLGRLRVAGKTGTLRPTGSDTTSSWFIGFAPSRRPGVVLSVLLQNGRVYREKANEVARDFLRVYFARRGFRGITAPE